MSTLLESVLVHTSLVALSWSPTRVLQLAGGGQEGVADSLSALLHHDDLKHKASRERRLVELLPITCLHFNVLMFTLRQCFSAVYL
jgi:hypothetical protein